MNFTYRKATRADLEAILEMLMEDDLGRLRENRGDYNLYEKAFKEIDADDHQYLMVVEDGVHMIATCHLTLMPSLTFKGSTRLQIEAVRVSGAQRGKGVGAWMVEQAIAWGKAQGACLVQLSTDKRRDRAKKFYESLKFKASHEGMKKMIIDD